MTLRRWNVMVPRRIRSSTSSDIALLGIVIRSVPIGNLKIVDPIWTTAYITRNHAYMVWDTLFSLDADNKPQPQMVDLVGQRRQAHLHVHPARRPQVA